MCSRTTRPLWTILLLLSIYLVTPLTAVTQTTEPQARKIVSEDFTKNRQEALSKVGTQESSVAAREKPKPRKRTYKLASAAMKPRKPQATVAQLGLTIWRLRAARAHETGARMLVRESNKTSERVPVRVEADATFSEGDQLRLTVESAQRGYLYVIDRELLADGSTGPAMLIYPWTGMPDDNQVGPGKLVDIPAQADDPSYFTAKRSSANHVGEMLTFIVSSTPFKLPISDKPLQITDSELAKWENAWGTPSERFEMEGGAGEVWTKEEQQAATHSGARQLTRDDPSPQTIYRVSVADNKAFLVNVQLRYDRPPR